VTSSPPGPTKAESAPLRELETGGLFVKRDAAGRERWYGKWRVGPAQVKRRIGLKRIPSTREGLTRTPAEAELRWLIGSVGPRGEEPLDETAAPGSDFLAEVTLRWERAASEPALGVRVAVTRTGVVLASRAGALSKMLPPFRLGVGGTVAGGRQYVPWIHLDDVVGALLLCLEHEQAVGPINLTAHSSVTSNQLAHTRGRVLRPTAIVPVPALALRVIYGEMATMALTGQRVMPTRLQQPGYRFSHPEREPALGALVAHS